MLATYQCWTGSHFLCQQIEYVYIINAICRSLCDLVKICSDVNSAIPDVCGQLLGALKAICLPTSRKPAFQQLVDKVNVRKMFCLCVFESVCVCVCVCVCVSCVLCL